MVTPIQYAERLTAWLNSQPEGAFQGGSVVDWAMESLRIANNHVYVLPGNHKLGQGYYQANVPVVVHHWPERVNAFSEGRLTVAFMAGSRKSRISLDKLS